MKTLILLFSLLLFSCNCNVFNEKKPFIIVTKQIKFENKIMYYTYYYRDAAGKISPPFDELTDKYNIGDTIK